MRRTATTVAVWLWRLAPSPRVVRAYRAWQVLDEMLEDQEAMLGIVLAQVRHPPPAMTRCPPPALRAALQPPPAAAAAAASALTIHVQPPPWLCPQLTAIAIAVAPAATAAHLAAPSAARPALCHALAHTFFPPRLRSASRARIPPANGPG